MRGHKGLRKMKRGSTKIENQGDIWYKMIQHYQITDFGKTLVQLYDQLSLELTGIETN